MANPIRRIVQLVFDRQSGARTEAQMKGSLNRVEPAFNRIRTAAVRLAAAIGLAFAVRKITQWTAAAVRAGIAAEETWSKFNTTFQDAAPAVDAFLADWTKLAGLTIAQGRDMAATMGAIAQGMGLTTDESAEFSSRMVQLAGDLASFNNVEVEDTFVALRAGVTGETEPLKRFGIQIKQAEVNLRAMAETGKTTTAELTNQEIAVARLNLIYERAGVQVGDLEATQDSTANTIRRLSGSWARLQESVGVALVQGNDARGILGQLIRVVENLDDWVKRNSESFAFLGVTIDKVVTVAGFLLRMVGRVGEVIATVTTFAFIPFIKATSLMVDSLALAGRGAAWLAEKLGLEGLAGGINETADAIQGAADALDELARSEFEVGRILLRRVIEGRPDREGPSRPGADRVDLPGGRGEGGEAPDAIDPEAIRRQNLLLSEAEALTRALRTPLEVYRDTIASLRGHLEAGRIDQETFNRGVAEARRIYEEARESIDGVTEALQRHENTLQAIGTLTGALGDDFNALEEEAASIEATLRTLAEEGVASTDERFAGLSERLGEVQTMMKLTGDEAMEVGKVAMVAGDLIGAAFGSGIGRLAEGKSRQNAILAAEHLAQGFSALLNPFTAPTAGGHFAAAAKFTAIAAAWKALGSFSGGSGGSVSGGSPATPGVAGDIGGGRSEAFDPSAPEVHIHFEGPGFEAVNPTVQRVVAGALQLVDERFGGNARVRVHRTEGGLNP